MSAYGFKSQLKGVLSDAVSYFQDSGDPNAACIKAANEAGFNADQADRLVETFNTARVICHYKSADEKSSPCSLADKETVRRQLSKGASSEKAAEYDTADYGCYKQAESDYVVPAVKEAEFVLKEEKLSKEAEDWLSIRDRNKVLECIKTAEEEARAAESFADEIAEKVAAAISRNVSIDDVHDKMARIVAAYAMDDRYAAGVEKVAAYIPPASDPDISLLQKYASMHVVDTSDLSEFVSAIKEASDFSAEAAAMTAYAETMRKQAQSVPGADGLPDDREGLENLLLRERILSERARREPAVPDNDAGRSSSSSGGKSSGGLSGLVDGKKFTEYLMDTVRSQRSSDSGSRINKATEGLNNVRRQLILQDLLVRDKVLSQEDPNRVAQIFRSVQQVSPDTTLNKEMLRSILRSAVQSVALSPYDAKTLADVDKSRRQAYDVSLPKSQSDIATKEKRK